VELGQGPLQCRLVLLLLLLLPHLGPVEGLDMEMDWEKAGSSATPSCWE